MKQARYNRTNIVPFYLYELPRVINSYKQKVERFWSLAVRIVGVEGLLFIGYKVSV